jgi:transposase-like protein
MTVYRWVTHCSRLTVEWMDAQGAKVGDRWHVDETVVSVNGEPPYLWNVLDAETRFLLSTHVSRNRNILNTRAPLRKAKANAEDRPREIFTDGMITYPRAIRREFGIHGRKSPHRRVPSIRARESNNMVERLNGTENERVKVMRGFDTPLGTAAISEGFRVHYNLVRTHQTIGTTPGLRAGLPYLGKNRWLELLKRVAPRQDREAVLEFVAE